MTFFSKCNSVKCGNECQHLHPVPVLTSYGMEQLSRRRHYQNPVMPCVSYGQSLISAVYSHLSWEGKDARWQGVSVKLDSHCMSLQQALVSVMTKGSFSKKHQPVSATFAYQGEEQVAMWSKQDQGGPARDLQFMPETRLTVVYHRVSDVIAKNSAANVV